MDRIHGLGAEMVAISVDDDVRQAGMAQRWGMHDIRFVADPGGERYLQALDMYDPDERGGIALPGMVVVGPDGAEVYRFAGRDFADRTNDDDVFAALEGLGLERVDPEPWTPEVDVPDGLGRFLAPRDLGPYMRGNLFGSVAIRRRLTGEGHDTDVAKAVAREHQAVTQATLDAWELWQAHVPEAWRP